MGPTDEMHTIKLMDLTTASTIFEQTMKLVPQYRHSINNREIFSIERNERKSETVEFSSEIGVAVSVSIVFLIVVIRVFASQCHKYKRMYKDICGSNHAICEDSSMHSPINANTVVGSEKNSMDVDKDGRTTSPDMLLSSEIINSETRGKVSNQFFF